MTREEFHENVLDLYDLVNFCAEIDYRLDIMDEDEKDNLYDELVLSVWPSRYYSWRDIQSKIEDIPTGYDWYREYDDGAYPADEDDFYELFDEVEEYCLNNYIFEDDDDEEEEIEEEEEVEEFETENIEVLFDTIKGVHMEMISAQKLYKDAMKEEIEKEREEAAKAEAEFKNFIGA